MSTNVSLAWDYAGENRRNVRRVSGARVDREYAEALVEWCNRFGWFIHPNQARFCQGLLTDPRHRCKDQGLWCGWFGVPGRNLTKTVLLRRGAPRAPERWAILSQPYTYDDPTNEAWHLGPAPYGHGTYALLYVGRPLALMPFLKVMVPPR